MENKYINMLNMLSSDNLADHYICLNYLRTLKDQEHKDLICFFLATISLKYNIWSFFSYEKLNIKSIDNYYDIHSENQKKYGPAYSITANRLEALLIGNYKHNLFNSGYNKTALKNEQSMFEYYCKRVAYTQNIELIEFVKHLINDFFSELKIFYKASSGLVKKTKYKVLKYGSFDAFVNDCAITLDRRRINSVKNYKYEHNYIKQTDYSTQHNKGFGMILISTIAFNKKYLESISINAYD